jgi:hypothetical protein
MNWRGRPLESYQAIVQLIAATTTVYRSMSISTRAATPKRIKITNQQMTALCLGKDHCQFSPCNSLHGYLAVKKIGRMGHANRDPVFAISWASVAEVIIGPASVDLQAAMPRRRRRSRVPPRQRTGLRYPPRTPA